MKLTTTGKHTTTGSVLCAAALAGLTCSPLAASGEATGNNPVENNPAVRQGAADKTMSDGEMPAHARQGKPGVHLADRVYLALATSPSLRTSTFDVTARDGVVTVKGKVPTQAARQRALHLAATPRGARSVVDQIQVDSSIPQASDDTAADVPLVEKVASAIAAKFPDAEVKKEWAYGWEIQHEEWAFDVDADLGYIFLRGTVPTWPAARVAVDTARTVPGVIGVGQRLRVGSPKQYDRQAVGYGFDEDAYWYDNLEERAGDAPASAPEIEPRAD